MHPAARESEVSVEQATRERESGSIQIAVLVGYGSLALPGIVRPNNLSLGVGARVGYTLPSPVRLHVGVEGMYHFGSSEVDAGAPAPATEAGRASYLSALVGYDLTLGGVVARPYAFGGAVFATRTYECARCDLREESSRTLPALGGGLFVGYFTRLLFVAVDGRVAAVTFDNPKTLLSFQGALGFVVR